MGKPVVKRKTLESDWTVATIYEVAAAVGLSERTVRQHLLNGCPGQTGAYSLPEISRWIRKKYEDEISSSLGRDLEKEKLAIDVETRRLKLRHLAGELVDRAAAKAEIEQMINVIRSRLEAAPIELSTGLPPTMQADFIADAKHKVNLILTELSRLKDDHSVNRQ